MSMRRYCACPTSRASSSALRRLRALPAFPALRLLPALAAARITAAALITALLHVNASVLHLSDLAGVFQALAAPSGI